MDVVVSVHQPNFLPWLKLLDKILGSDVYVAYDSVIYTRSEYHGRQRIKRDGRPDWLSVPLVKVRGTQQLIHDVRIDEAQPFRKQHLRMLKLGYAKAPYFDEVFPIVEEVYGRGQERLVDLNVDLIEAVCRYLNSSVRIVRAGDLEGDLRDEQRADGTGRIIELVRSVGGTVHLTSTWGTQREYIDWARVAESGLRVWSQDFTHPEHPQGRGEFLEHLACLDMLFHCGRSTADVLATNRSFVDVTAAAA